MNDAEREIAETMEGNILFHSYNCTGEPSARPYSEELDWDLAKRVYLFTSYEFTSALKCGTLEDAIASAPSIWKVPVYYGDSGYAYANVGISGSSPGYTTVYGNADTGNDAPYLFEPEIVPAGEEGQPVKLGIPLWVLGEEHISVLRGRLASVQHLHYPSGRHPRAEKVGHTAHENGLRLSGPLRFSKPIAVECRVKLKGERGVMPSVVVENRGIENMLSSICLCNPLALMARFVVVCLARAPEPSGNPPGVAILAPVLAARDRVPCAVAPFDVAFLHCSVSSLPGAFAPGIVSIFD